MPDTIVTLTPITEDARIWVGMSITTSDPVGHYHLQSSSDLGVTWNTVRFADTVPPEQDQSGWISDYEALANRPTVYRAMAFDSEGEPLTEWSSLVSETLEVKRWWLKDPFSPQDNMKIDLVGDSFDFEENEDKGRFRPLGRTTPIIVSDVVRAPEFSQIQFETEGIEQYRLFKRLRNRQRTLLLQGSIDEQWYIRLGENLQVSIINTQTDYRRLSINADTQRRP